MKILLIGDPHFKNNNTRDTECMVERILEIARNESPDLIVNLGDTLDRHETVHISPLLRSVYFMKELKKIAYTAMIIGNHDRPKNTTFLTNEHAFTALAEWPSDEFLLVDSVEIINCQDYKIVLVPYVSPGRFEEALQTCPNALDPAPDLILCHQEFLNAKMGPITSTEGDPWSLEYPLVISGHIHDYDHLQENIIYIGTPIQHGFGDKDEKGVFIFDTEIKKLRKIPLKVARKITLVTSVKDLENAKIKIQALQSNGHSIKLIIEGTTDELAKCMRKLIIQDVKISYKDITVKEPYKYTNIEPENFMKALRERIKDDPELNTL
jgi:DNA repair exonuclease SbcCD nuclease subunit